MPLHNDATDHVTFNSCFLHVGTRACIQCTMALNISSVCGLCGEDNEEHLKVMVFSTGAVIEYTVPSFPVSTVEICEMKCQFVVDDEQESNDIYDGCLQLNTDVSTSTSLH